MPVTLNNCGSTLAGASDTISWTDTDSPIPPARRYDIFVNGVDIGPSLQQPTNSVTYNGFPTDGSQVEVCVQIKDDGQNTNDQVCCNYTAHNDAAPAETTMEGCPSGPLVAPADFNLRLVLAPGHVFVSWQCFVNGVDQELPDQSNPGYGVVGAPAGEYVCLGTYIDGDGVSQTFRCDIEVTAPAHEGCPATGEVNVGDVVDLTAPHGLAAPVTYQHVINGVLSADTSASPSLSTAAPGEVTVSTTVCTEGGVDNPPTTKCSRHPCAQTTVIEEVQVGAVGDTHSYSKRRAFSCDGSKVLLSNGGNGIFDTTTLQQIDSAPLTSRSVFSCKDPDLIFGVARNSANDRANFVAYNHVTNTTTVLFDAADYYGESGCDVTIGEFEGTVQNDEFVVLQVECPSGTELVSLQLTGPYSAGNTNVLASIPRPSIANHSGYDLTGDYIFIATGDQGDQYIIYDRFFNVLGTEANATGAVDTAHGDFFITQGGNTGYLTVDDNGENFLDFATNTWTQITSSGITKNRHVSGVASINCPGLFFSTNSLTTRDSFLTMLDANLNVAWELNLGVLGSTLSFQAQPKGTISPCGDMLLYTSDRSGSPRDYIIRLDNSACPEIEPVAPKECKHFYCSFEVVAEDDPTPNNPPTATGNNKQTSEGVALSIQLGGSDSDGTVVDYVIKSGPTYGTLTGSGANRVYTPNAGYSGPDSFTFCAVDDDGAQSQVAVCQITVTPDDDTGGECVRTVQAITAAPANPLPGQLVTMTFSGCSCPGCYVSLSQVNNGAPAVQLSNNGQAVSGGSISFTNPVSMTAGQTVRFASRCCCP